MPYIFMAAGDMCAGGQGPPGPWASQNSSEGHFAPLLFGALPKRIEIRAVSGGLFAAP